MGRTVISEAMLDKLEASLKECFYIHAKVISRSQAVMHVKPQRNGVSMGWLAVAMEKASLETSKYSVLLEEDYSDSFSPKFINCGYYFINMKLAETFGGCVSNSRYWILYNEVRGNGCSHGYKGEHLPTAEEIIHYIEELYAQM